MTAGFVSAIKFDVTEPDLHCFIHYSHAANRWPLEFCHVVSFEESGFFLDCMLISDETCSPSDICQFYKYYCIDGLKNGQTAGLRCLCNSHQLHKTLI